MVIVLIFLTAAVGVAADIIQIEPKQTTLIPQTKVLYTLIIPPMLYETDEPGPREKAKSIAWKLANEFIYRTSLREKVQLPALKAVQHKIGVMVVFSQKDSKKKIHIFVRSDMKTIEYKK